MTISELAKLNKANGGHFFDRDTMAHFGDTMKGFTFKDNKDGTGVVTRKRDGQNWTFDTKTGRINFAAKFQEKLNGCRVISVSPPRCYA